MAGTGAGSKVTRERDDRRQRELGRAEGQHRVSGYRPVALDANSALNVMHRADYGNGQDVGGAGEAGRGHSAATTGPAVGCEAGAAEVQSRAEVDGDPGALLPEEDSRQQE